MTLTAPTYGGEGTSASRWPTSPTKYVHTVVYADTGTDRVKVVAICAHCHGPVKADDPMQHYWSDETKTTLVTAHTSHGQVADDAAYQ